MTDSEMDGVTAGSEVDVNEPDGANNDVGVNEPDGPNNDVDDGAVGDLAQ